jgi:hypothetical protein
MHSTPIIVRDEQGNDLGGEKQRPPSPSCAQGERETWIVPRGANRSQPTTAYRDLTSGGATNSTITNQGFAYDPNADTWTALPTSNNTLDRGGFYKKSTEMLPAMPTSSGCRRTRPR